MKLAAIADSVFHIFQCFRFSYCFKLSSSVVYNIKH